MCANGYNVADSFVPADEREFARKRPVTLAGMQVRVTHASAIHLDETFSWGELFRLLDRVVVLNLYRRIV